MKIANIALEIANIDIIEYLSLNYAQTIDIGYFLLYNVSNKLEF